MLVLDGSTGASKVQQAAVDEKVAVYGLGVQEDTLTLDYNSAPEYFGEGNSFPGAMLSPSSPNTPDNTQYFHVVHFFYSGGTPTKNCTQVAWPYLSEMGSPYIRSRYDGTWTAWRKMYNQKNTVGTVGQSGGVPTGAIMEKGSNANGNYTKFTDGTMLCWHNQASSAAGDVTWTFPAAFSPNAPAVVGSGLGGGAIFVSPASINVSSTAWSAYNYNGARVTNGCFLTAIGRWF